MGGEECRRPLLAQRPLCPSWPPQKKVIVAKLSAIEELAGMTILCSDKTGTLTLNQLSLREPKCFGDM